MAASHPSLYPSPAPAEISEAYIGKRLQDIPTPAAIVDRAIVRRNCLQMLQACQAVGCSFRPHVKTHKTVEVTRLQAGELTERVHIVVSTLAEFEHLLGYLIDCQDQGKIVNVLYGIPVPPSSIHQLARLGKKLHPGSVSVLVDHHDQLQYLEAFKDVTGYRLVLYIKIDTGYHRAGVAIESSQFSQLVSHILPEGADLPSAELRGLYSHAGHSYAGNSAEEAMDLLTEEIKTLQAASAYVKKRNRAHRPMILSVGATPTATSIQHLAKGGSRSSSQHPIKPGQIDMLDQCLHEIKDSNDTLEIHAGVYPFLDLQQLATQASPTSSTSSVGPTGLTYDLALTIIVEVASLYNARDEPEALIAAGSLALGREPCKSYQGWGIVSDWNIASRSTSMDSYWQVGRISQEHGILTQQPHSSEPPSELYVGQKLRIYPNHACIAGAHFGWYFVVDSDLPEERRDEIVEVWIRCQGW